MKIQHLILTLLCCLLVSCSKVHAGWFDKPEDPQKYRVIELESQLQGQRNTIDQWELWPWSAPWSTPADRSHDEIRGEIRTTSTTESTPAHVAFTGAWAGSLVGYKRSIRAGSREPLMSLLNLCKGLLSLSKEHGRPDPLDFPSLAP